MNNACTWCLGLILIWTCFAQSAPRPAAATDASPRIAERGPHHRVWQPANEIPTGGTPATHLGPAWTELATGLHYFEDGEWKETLEEIEIVNGAAIARHGPHKVALAANLHSPGAIELVAPDGQRFRSHVLGLAYTDSATGRSVMIAAVKDCAGALHPPRQVIYADAFEGDCAADVRYTYTRRGFEQDVILRQAPPSPAEWGLPPETTRLEVFTEFIELPPHGQTEVVLRREANRARAARMAEPDLVDQQLDFGAMRFGPGQAFPLSPPSPASRRAVPTGKSLEVIDGRVFLIEKVDYPALRESFADLPQAAAPPHPRPVTPAANRSALARFFLPRPDGAAGQWNNHQLARLDSDRPGVVLDYFAVNASLTGWRFRSDMTYLVTDTVDLHGVTVLEGAVIKFAPGASLQVWGELDCQTSTYRPAIFTARDDHGAGLATGRSTEWPRGTYALPALAFRGAGRRYALHHVSIRHADTAIIVHDHVDLDLAHAQIVRGRVGVAWHDQSHLSCRNFLLADLDSAFEGASGAPALRGEHGTVHRVNQLIGDTTSPCRLTNSLLVAVTNNTHFEGDHVVSVSRDPGIFQTAGGGAHYLSAASPYRNAGTVTIDPALRRQLRGLTTHPPLRLRGDFIHDTVLRPQARRDTDQPDLGYHYPSLDYRGGGLRIANARLIVEAGVTIGLDTTGVAYGLGLDTGAQLIAHGRPQDLTRLVQLSAIQEGLPTTRAAGDFAALVRVLPDPSTEPILRWRHVESVLPAGAGAHLAGPGPIHQPFDFHDCQFAGARISVGDIGLAVTNCIFDRVHLEVDASDDEPPRHFHQNFFRGGTVQIELPTSTQVHARNNFFDRTALRISGTWHCSHNAYVAGCDRLGPAGPSDRILTDVRFQPGPLGAFYQPGGGGAGTLATLFDSGSASAGLLGLSHHTSRVDQTPEGSSVVDIGFHYLATDSRGRLLDQDGDGLADHVEDANGNGVTDAGETDWERYTSAHHLPAAPALQVFTPLK